MLVIGEGLGDAAAERDEGIVALLVRRDRALQLYLRIALWLVAARREETA